MTFIYTYRGASGAIEKAEIEAESRSEVFVQLKERGIAPLQVQEGKLPKSKAKAVGPGGKRNPVAIFVAVAAVAIVGVVVWLVADGGTGTKKPSSKPSVAAKPAAGAIPPKTGPDAAPAAATNQTESVKPTAVAKVPAASAPVATNAVETAAKAETNKVIVVNRGPGVFKNSTEQLLSLIFTCELGNTPPPLPRITNVTKEQLEAILASPNIVGEKDSEKVADAKRTVELAKKELKDYLDKGGDVNEFMAYYRGQLLQAHNMWKDEQVAMMKTCREEDPEVAKAMLESANKRLAEKGIKPIMMPPIYKKKLGLE